MPKRPLEADTSLPTAVSSRKNKRARISGANDGVATSRSHSAASASPLKPLGSLQITAADEAAAKKAARKAAKHEQTAGITPPKRPLLPGRVKRLGVPRPQSLTVRNGSSSTRADINRRGSKISKGWGSGGFDVGVPVTAANDEDIDVGVSVTMPNGSKDKGKGTATANETKKKKAQPAAELWVTRRSSFSAYMRSGVAAFVEKGHHTLVLRALGAAIPTCMSLSMAIRDALPCGTSSSVLEIRTGSVDVNDEVIPPDDSENEDVDIQYQVRTKSSIECTLALKKAVRQRMLVQATGVSMSRLLGAKEMGVRPGRGGRNKAIRGRLGRGGGHGAKTKP